MTDDPDVATIIEQFPGARVTAIRETRPRMTIAQVVDYETTGTQDDDYAEIIEMARTAVNVDGAFLVPDAWWH